MRTVAEFERIADILRQRLRAGQYGLTRFPAERDLATEFGASYLTAHKAVQQLILEGLPARSARGRAEPVASDPRPLIVFLSNDWPSVGKRRRRQALQDAAATAGCAFRAQHYLHWGDPIIADTLRHAAGVLVMPMAEELPPSLLASLGEGPARVLVSGNNLGSHGLRTLDLLPAQAVRMALDHLAAAGHRRLLVFNVQPRDAIIGTRIDEAQVWARSHPEVTVTIAGEAVASGEKTLPAARIQARQLLQEQHPTAVLALTLPAAQGMIRVAVDSGLPPGRAFAVATIDGEGIAEELVPSITSVDLDPVDLSHLLAEAVTWMRGADWPGTKAHACQPVLHVRESTDGVR